MNTRETGIRNFRRRLAIAIRDGVLNALANPAGEANLRDIPLEKLGPIADLTTDQRSEWKKLFAEIIDRGIQHFLYGLDNQADGFEIRYYGELLNVEGICALSGQDIPIAEESDFDGVWNKKTT